MIFVITFSLVTIGFIINVLLGLMPNNFKDKLVAFVNNRLKISYTLFWVLVIFFLLIISIFLNFHLTKKQSNSDKSSNKTTVINYNNTGDIVYGNKIVNIYSKSEDYKFLETQIKTLQNRKKKIQKRIEQYPNDNDFKIELSYITEELNKYETQIEDYKSNVIKLYETFTKIEVNSERLQQAKVYFEQGKFREADALLKTEKMSSDLEKLEIREKHLDKEKKGIQEKRKQIADEFLVKAQLWQTFYSEPNWFEKTQEYYEKALNANRNYDILFKYASFLYKHNKYEKTESLYKEGLEKLKKNLKVNSYLYLTYLASILNNLGELYRNKNKNNKALESYQEALKIERKLAKIKPKIHLLNVANILNNLSILQRKEKKNTQALSNYEEALEIYKQLEQENPQSYLPYIAIILNNLGNLYNFDNKQYKKALENYQKALNIRIILTEKNPKIYLPYVATTLNNIATLQQKTNQFDKALENFQEALKIYKQLAKENPQAYLPNVALTLSNLSVLYLKCIPNRKLSVQYAREVIQISKDFQHVPRVQEYKKIALEILKFWEEVEKELKKKK